MRDSHLFQSVDLPTLQRNLVELLRQTAREKGRVEIRGLDAPCVLLSKAELDALEQALDFLSNTDVARHFHGHVRQCARQDVEAASVSLA